MVSSSSRHQIDADLIRQAIACPESWPRATTPPLSAKAVAATIVSHRREPYRIA
jgi:hypothetical protein